MNGIEYDFPEEDIDWQKELTADPGYQEWLDQQQRSDLAYLIEDYNYDSDS